MNVYIVICDNNKDILSPPPSPRLASPAPKIE